MGYTYQSHVSLARFCHGLKPEIERRVRECVSAGVIMHSGRGNDGTLLFEETKLTFLTAACVDAADGTTERRCRGLAPLKDAQQRARESQHLSSDLASYREQLRRERRMRT
jgi:hypothetical protein